MRAEAKRRRDRGRGSINLIRLALLSSTPRSSAPAHTMVALAAPAATRNVVILGASYAGAPRLASSSRRRRIGQPTLTTRPPRSQAHERPSCCHARFLQRTASSSSTARGAPPSLSRSRRPRRGGEGSRGFVPLALLRTS